MKREKDFSIKRVLTLWCLAVTVLSLGCSSSSQRSAAKPASTGGCEEAMGSGPSRYTYISGNGFKLRRIDYKAISGKAVVEGDIVLGSVAEMEEARHAVENKKGDLGNLGVVISGSVRRWPEQTIYFTIASDLPKTNRVTEAIAHWEKNTGIRFKKRTSELNYVTFQPGTGCSAGVGMQGKQQFVTIEEACGTGQVIHEIGHTVGLWHEQSREDRDKFVEIKLDNVKPDMKSQFQQKISDGDDIGDYDFDSVMHYGTNFFAIDPKKPTIVTKPPGKTIGQRKALSAGDIATVKKIYP